MGQQRLTQWAVVGEVYFSGLLDVLLGIWSNRKRRHQQSPYIEQCQTMVGREPEVIQTRGRLSICGLQPQLWRRFWTL